MSDHIITDLNTINQGIVNIIKDAGYENVDLWEMPDLGTQAWFKLCIDDDFYMDITYDYSCLVHSLNTLLIYFKPDGGTRKDYGLRSGLDMFIWSIDMRKELDTKKLGVELLKYIAELII